VRFPAARARSHLLSLAGTRVTVEWIEGSIYEAASRPGRWPAVYTPRPTTVLKYLVGLHELGHVMRPHGEGLVNEANAWAWAAENVHPDFMPWVDYRLWREVSALFATHLPWPSDPSEPA